MHRTGPAFAHTFVVPAHGNSPFLAACLTSLRDQTIQSDIVITTATPSAYLSEIASHFGVPLIQRDGRPAIGADWNFALRHGHSDLITIAHQDDTYDSTFVETSTRSLAAYPEAGICFTGYREVNETDISIMGRQLLVKDLLRLLFGRGRPIVGPAQRLLLSFGCPIPCPAVTFRKSALPPDFEFSSSFQVNLDWDAWWRLYEAAVPFVAVERRLMSHRVHRAATTAQAKRDGRRAKEDGAMFRRIWPQWMAPILGAAYRLGY